MMDFMETQGIRILKPGLATSRSSTAMKSALPLRCRHIETAERYGNEDATDQAIAASDPPIAMRKRSVFAAIALASFLPCSAAAAENKSSAIQVQTLTQSTSSWDGTPYKAYPAGQPQITILKFTIAPHTTMQWHSHPLPNAAYILSGDLTVEKKDGTKQHFVAGQALTETVDSVHRGITGAASAVLIVFYPGTPGLPLASNDH